MDRVKANNVRETKGFLETKNVEHRESEVKKKNRHNGKAKRSRLSLEENDEKIKDPGLNELEFFVMHSITQHANSKKDVKSENSHFCDIFSKIVIVVNSFAFLMVLPIFHHSLQVLYDEKRKYDKLRKC